MTLTAQDPQAANETHIQDLLAQMTLAEKIGQMTLVEKNSIAAPDITQLFIGGLLSGGGGYPTPNTAKAWRDMVRDYQDRALATRLGIPMIYGVDAVHGHNNVYGPTIFPHNIALGATRNADLVRQIGRATALEMVATGVYWNYAPALSIPNDIRWGRTYEGYGQDPALVTELALAYFEGLQGVDGDYDLSRPDTVLATPKHYVGDGGTSWGTSRMVMLGREYDIDQGVTELDEDALRATHLAPYLPLLPAGALSVMAFFSSWGGYKMHANRYLLTDVLKGEFGFQGFVVSDWQAIYQVAEDYYDAVVACINAGVDMNMVPFDYKQFIATLTKAVEQGDVTEARIDDAVARILRAKLALNLFERPFPEDDSTAKVGAAEHRALARQAVSESLVLLKNEGGLLPLDATAEGILVGGAAAVSVGLQSGGWTIEWQGKDGDITPGTHFLDALQAAVSPQTLVAYNRFGRFDELVEGQSAAGPAEIGIVVIAEQPYAEGMGDRADLTLGDEDRELIARVAAQSERTLLILFSGRPLIITEELEMVDACVAAWLPGTEGQGITDVLFGDKPFTGKLSFNWPRSMAQIPNGQGGEPLFAIGFGLTTN